MKKKKSEKKNVQEAVGWATADFPVLSRDTVDCIVTGKGAGTQYGQVAHAPHGAAALRHGRPARRASGARAHPGHSVSRFKILYHGKEAATRQEARCDTAPSALQYDTQRARGLGVVRT